MDIPLDLGAAAPIPSTPSCGRNRAEKSTFRSFIRTHSAGFAGCGAIRQSPLSISEANVYDLMRPRLPYAIVEWAPTRAHFLP
jgi:hypothetical protein